MEKTASVGEMIVLGGFGGEKHCDRDDQFVVADQVEDAFSSIDNATANTTNGIRGNVPVGMDAVAMVCDRLVGAALNVQAKMVE